MFSLKARPLVLGGGSFLLCLAGGLVWRVSLPSMEVFFSGTPWCAFTFGALAGAALGLKRKLSLPGPSRVLLPAAGVFFFFLLLRPAYGFLAPRLPGDGILFLLAVAAPAFAVFFPFGRLLSSLTPAGRLACAPASVGALSGLLAASLLYSGRLEGAVSGTVTLAFALPAAAAAAWLLPRLAAGGGVFAPGGTISGSRVIDVAARLEGRLPEPVLAMAGSSPSGPVCFLVGASLATVYPVTRRLLLQLPTGGGGAEVEIFSSLVAGALLGSLFLALLVPEGRPRNGAVLAGALFTAGSLYLLAREFSLTQNVRDFTAFREYLESLRGRHASFLPPDLALYIAFTGPAGLAAGMFLGGLRGSPRSFLLGLAAGCLLCSGAPLREAAASDLVLLALYIALAGALLFALRGFFAGREFLPFALRLFFLGAAVALTVFAVGGAGGLKRTDYPDLPLPGEEDLLLFAPGPGGNLRVTADRDGRVMVRLDARYLWGGRRLDRVGELAGSLPRLALSQGRFLVAGPLASLAAPLVRKTEPSQGFPPGGSSPVALETIPVLGRAEDLLARKEGIQAAANSAKESRGALPFLLRSRRSFETVLFLPSPLCVDAGRGFLSREVFEVVKRSLARNGTFWLCLDTGEIDAPTAGRVAGAFAAVFEGSSLWLLDDGLAPPFLVLAGLEGRTILDPDRAAAVIEEDLARRGPAAARFRSFGELTESLLAGPEGMARLREVFGEVSAARPFPARPPAPGEGGFAAVRRLLEVLPPAGLEDVFGRSAPGGKARRRSRGLVLEAAAFHDRLDFRIDEGHDIDWKLFHDEISMWRRAFEACPDTALGRRIFARIASRLIDAKEFQAAFEAIRDAAGKAPRDVVLRCDLGFISFQLLDFAAAAPHFAAAAAGDAHFTEAFLYGGLNAFALGRKKEAARLLEKARTLDAGRILLYEPLARSLFDLGKPGEALRIAREGLKRAPGDEGLQTLVRLIGAGRSP